MTKRAGTSPPPANEERPKRHGRHGQGTGTAAAPAAARPLRVLVVDDDRVDRIALTRALGQTGFDVTVGEADGVLAAIDLLAGSSFDCVLLDYNLPDGDGLTFLRGLRGAGISVTVVMITGQQDSAVASDLVEAGAADYIPKGLFTPGLLAQTLARLFGDPSFAKDSIP
ncbi:MAG TPA: response regulator [Thermoanaerobaculia bacterium]|nr:response regulator [Thermoanaerobaculia bacterium]